MALTLDIGANPRGATSAVKNLGDDLGDVVDALEDVGRQGERAGDKLDDALRQAERQAKQTDTAVDKVGSSGFHKAGEASGEFKQEALANLSEVTSSFDGSMSSIGDLVQGTLGGIAGSIPGIGLAGAAAAVGVGALVAAFQAGDQAAKESAERVSEWADAFIESGGRVLDESIILSRAHEIATDTTGRLAQAQEISRASGVGLSEVIRALSGDQTQLATVQDAMVAATDRAAAASAAQEVQTTSAAGAVIAQQDAVNAANSALSALSDELDRGAAGAAIYQGAVAAGKDETIQFTNAVNGIPEVKTVRVDVEVNDQKWREWDPGTKYGTVVGNVRGATWE